MNFNNYLFYFIIYFKGLCGGGIYGFLKGWTKPQPILNYKLRLNRALNLSTKYGPWAGNSMGVLGINSLFYIIYIFIYFYYN